MPAQVYDTRIVVRGQLEKSLVSCVALVQVRYRVSSDSEPYHQPYTSSYQKDSRCLQDSILLTLLRTVYL